MRSLIHLLPEDPPEAFPPVERALTHPDGLLCVGGDLKPERLVAAYRRGIFPWFSEGQPILWWAPALRCALPIAERRTPRSVRRALRRMDDVEVSVDACFAEVVAGCAQPRYPGDGTWITPNMKHAYQRLHERGVAHSLEVTRDGELVGGLYGVAIGGLFAAESMFGRETGGSRLALAMLMQAMAEHRMSLLDCQLASEHVQRLGARDMSRSEYGRRLERALQLPEPTALWRPGPLVLADDPRGRA